MFASRPLAELQAEQAANAERTFEGARAVTTEAPRRAAPVPVLDINFEDLPDEAYEEFAFPLQTTPGTIYVLGIEDDSILFEIQEVARDEAANDIIKFALHSTFRRAIDAEGNEIEDGLKILMDAIDPNRKGPKERRKYLMEVVLAAVDKWSEELTDVSMRPMNRAQRRARRR